MIDLLSYTAMDDHIAYAARHTVKMRAAAACLAPREILLVGNGPSALSYPLGEDIDRFPDVVRFNEFQVTGFERYIGHRLTLWAMSSNMAPMLLGAYPERHRASVLIAVPQRGFRNCTYPMLQTETLARLPPTFQQRANFTERSVANELRDRHGLSSRPSSGLLVLLQLLRQYRLVHIHGFDYFAGNAGAGGHYYTDGKGVASRHDTSQEARVARQLVADGRVQPLSECIAAGVRPEPRDVVAQRGRSSRLAGLLDRDSAASRCSPRVHKCCNTPRQVGSLHHNRTRATARYSTQHVASGKMVNSIL